MTKKQRHFLFYFCISLFLILSYFASLYAIGYKYDFLHNRFVKTGSLSLKTQNNANVFINDRKVGATSFFNGFFSKGGLLPREYSVSIEKDGYRVWQKKVLLKEGFISDFSYVHLVRNELTIDIITDPTIASRSFSEIILANDDKNQKLAADLIKITLKEIKKIDKLSDTLYVLTKKNGYFYKIENDSENQKPELLSSNIENFIFSHDSQKLLWYNENELWVEWLKDSNRQPYKNAGDRELIIRTSEAIHGAEWYSEDGHLFVSIGNRIEFIELDSRGERNTYKIYESDNIKDISYNQKSEKLFILLTDKILSVEI